MKPQRPSHVPRKNPQGSQSADDLAAEILGFLAADPDRLTRFFDLTGLTPPILREAATAPGFAASLVNYLAEDERLLIAFAAETGRDPENIHSIYQCFTPLIGGDL